VSDTIDQASIDHPVELGGNNAPVAVISWSVAPDPNPGQLTINFVGSGSFDPDPGGTITSYLWNFGDGTTSSQISPSHTYPSAGVYLVTLTVRDERDGVGSDTLTVGVGDIPNQGPTARLTADTNFGNAPLTVNFSAANSTDPDGDPLTYNWTFGDGGTASGAIVQYTYNNQGTFRATVIVRDPEGGTDDAFLYISVVGTSGGDNGGPGFGFCGTQAFGASLACLCGMGLMRWRRRRR
jgi:PKD repeat protein